MVKIIKPYDEEGNIKKFAKADMQFLEDSKTMASPLLLKLQ